MIKIKFPNGGYGWLSEEEFEFYMKQGHVTPPKVEGDTVTCPEDESIFGKFTTVKHEYKKISLEKLDSYLKDIMPSEEIVENSSSAGVLFINQNTKMKDPKELGIIYGRDEKTLIAVELPVYQLGEKGMEDTGLMFRIPFAKGVIGGPEYSHKQKGVFTESIIQASIEYLSNVNQGDLQNIHTTEAIQYLKAALGALDARRQKRVNDGTIFTNRK